MRYPSIFEAFGRSCGLPPSEWAQVERLLRFRRYPRGENLVRAGEPATDFAVILSGLFRVYYLGSGGEEYTKAFHSPPEVVGPFADLLEGRAAAVSIEAIEDSEVLQASYAGFTRLYARHPGWQELGRRIAEAQFLYKDRREHDLVFLSATERYLKFKREHPSLKGRVSQQTVATFLGITPVALSRIVGRLRRSPRTRRPR